MNPYLALPVLAALTLLLAIAWPLWRSYRRHGVLALERPRDPVQRFLHGAFTLALLGYGAFTLALYLLGAARLGVFGVPGPVLVAGLATSVAGLLLVIVAQAQMGASWRIGLDDGTTSLVTGGVFALCRNPIYLGLLGITGGFALMAPSGWTLVGLALVYTVVGFQARAEEAHLRETHGPAFRAWAGRVGRFVPGLGRIA